jgi:hypothetical protein
MTSFGEFPLVFQKQLKDGVLIPVGLAEASSLGSFSAVNIVVSSISATDYLGFEANVSFTGVLTVESTGTGIQLVDVTYPNNPVIRSLATPTTNFLEPSLAGNGTVNIGYGVNPLGFDHGGTNTKETPVANGVAHWLDTGTTFILDTAGDFTFDKTNLSIPAAGRYQLGGTNLNITHLDNVIAPTNPNTFLQWNGTYYIFTSVTGTGGGGGASFPNVAGRIPITDTTTNLNTYADLAYNSSTKVVSTYAINNVCDVCAIRLNEGGTLLSDKYQAKDATLDTIASLNPGANQLIYFTNTNAAATASVTPCGLELLNDATFAEMRTTLELNTYYQPIGAYLTAIPSEYLTLTEADAIYQPCNVFLDTLASQNYVDLGSVGQVYNTLAISNGGTNKSSFTNNGAVIHFDSGLAGSFTENSNFTFLSNTLKSPTVCATMVCATTVTEGGTTLASKYLTQANAATTYQPCDVFLTTLATNDAIRLDLDVTNTLGVTRGGTGLTTISNNQIVVGNGTNTIGTITTPTDGTYLKYNTAGGFSWSLIPTGTGTTLPSEPCAVVFMNTTGTALTANKGIRVNNSLSTLEIFSNQANGTGGINIAPDIVDEGLIRWDHDYDTLGIQGINNTNIALGVDELIPITNNTGATIEKGQVIYVSGSSGGSHRGTVSLLSNTNRTASIIGVCLHQITNGNSGYAIKKGLIKNVSLTSVQVTGDPTWAVGDTLYVGTTAGKMSKVPPAAGNRAAKIGIVLHLPGSNVSFGVNVDRGYDLSELHDVCATPSNNGDILVWNTAGTGYYTTGTINNITGTLSVSKGGTGKTSFAATQLIFGNTLDQDASLTFTKATTTFSSTNVCAVVVGATTITEGGTSLTSKYLTQANAATTYQPTSTRLHELTGVTADGLLRFNGSNYVSQPTATYETTAYSRNTFETTGYARSTYETTGYSRNTFETTGYSRNNFETTGYSRTNFETTGYSRSTFATTASLASYETTAYSRPNFATTASLTSYETTGYSRSTFATTASLTSYETTAYARNTYETTAYSRNSFATTATLSNYTLTSTFNTFSQGVTDNHGVVFANGTNLDTVNTFIFVTGTNTLRATTVSSDSTYFLVNSTSKSLNGTLAWYDIPTNFGDANAYAGGLVYVTGTDKSQINSNLTFDEANNRLKVTTVSATTYNNLALSSQLSDVQITATITNGYALKWNSTLSKWTPQQDQTGGGGATPVGNEGAIQFNREGAFYGDETKLMFVTGTSVLKTPTVSATTVSAGTIHVGGSDGYIRNNNGSIGISSIGGSVSISGTNSISLQGIGVDQAQWPQTGTGNGVIFYSEGSNKFLNIRLNSSVINGSRDYFNAPANGYVVASYLTSSNDDYFAINPYWNSTTLLGVPDLPSNKDVLVYNNNLYGYALKGWTWEQLSLAGGYLSDVNTANANTNDTLVYNGSTWTPVKPVNMGMSYVLGNNLTL